MSNTRHVPTKMVAAPCYSRFAYQFQANFTHCVLSSPPIMLSLLPLVYLGVLLPRVVCPVSKCFSHVVVSFVDTVRGVCVCVVCLGVFVDLCMCVCVRRFAHGFYLLVCVVICLVVWLIVCFIYSLFESLGLIGLLVFSSFLKCCLFCICVVASAAVLRVPRNHLH